MHRLSKLLATLALALVLVPAGLAIAAGLDVAGTPMPTPGEVSIGQAGEQTFRLVEYVSKGQWMPALSALLMILAWALKQPWTGALFSKIPPRRRPLVMAAVGGVIASGGFVAMGTSPLLALVMGLQSSIGATGLYENLDAIFSKPNAEEQRLAEAAAKAALAVKAEVAKALALPPAERDAALARIGTGVA